MEASFYLFVLVRRGMRLYKNLCNYDVIEIFRFGILWWLGLEVGMKYICEKYIKSSHLEKYTHQKKILIFLQCSDIFLFIYETLPLFIYKIITVDFQKYFTSCNNL